MLLFNDRSTFIEINHNSSLSCHCDNANCHWLIGKNRFYVQIINVSLNKLNALIQILCIGKIYRIIIKKADVLGRLKA
jgi:hypothetical protein